jgi:glycosyltransferase involved in cell wall biosynthesis
MPQKILQIGNYPPPMCGWAVQTVLLDRELRRRGHIAAVLNVNESRKIKSPNYVDVQNGVDFAWKVLTYTLRGYRVHAHLNAESYKLYLMDLFALSVARLAGRPAILTFHGGLPQKYFPKTHPRWMRWAFQLTFALAKSLTCDSDAIKQALVGYGVPAGKIASIPCFSEELLKFETVSLPPEIERFLNSHHPVFLCYVSFRPEYRLPVLRQAMQSFCQKFSHSGFIWLGFPTKELPAAQQFVSSWAPEERESILLLGNLDHDAFLTLLSRCFACVRTPACDGISSSVLESLALGVPVVASENGRRPPGVITYAGGSPDDLCAKLSYLVAHHVEVKSGLRLEGAENNTRKTANWILGEAGSEPAEVSAHAAH